MSASVAIFDAETVHNGTASPVTLTGYTHDISPVGLSVIVPSANIDERYCSQHHSLQMMIDLPNKPLEVEARIIHCKPLDKFDAAKGYLIGAQIAQSSGEKAAALANHLSRLTECD